MIIGFEWEAIDECKEKLGKDVQVVKQRGRIYFNIDWDQFPKVFFLFADFIDIYIFQIFLCLVIYHVHDVFYIILCHIIGSANEIDR